MQRSEHMNYVEEEVEEWEGEEEEEEVENEEGAEEEVTHIGVTGVESAFHEETQMEKIPVQAAELMVTGQPIV